MLIFLVEQEFEKIVSLMELRECSSSCCIEYCILGHIIHDDEVFFDFNMPGELKVFWTGLQKADRFIS